MVKQMFTSGLKFMYYIFSALIASTTLLAVICISLLVVVCCCYYKRRLHYLPIPTTQKTPSIEMSGILPPRINNPIFYIPSGSPSGSPISSPMKTSPSDNMSESDEEPVAYRTRSRY